MKPETFSVTAIQSNKDVLAPKAWPKFRLEKRIRNTVKTKGSLRKATRRYKAEIWYRHNKKKK